MTINQIKEVRAKQDASWAAKAGHVITSRNCVICGGRFTTTYDIKLCSACS